MKNSLCYIQPQLIILAFIALCWSCKPQPTHTGQQATETSKKKMSDPQKLNGTWILSSLNGSPVYAKDFMKGLPSLELFPSENRFSGSDGCNRMKGGLTLDTERIQFLKVVTSRMACPGMKKASVSSLLLKIDAWKSEGNTLKMFSAGKIMMVWKKETK